MVRRITLNRPEKRNPLGATMRAEILHTLHAHDLDPDVRVTVIRGAGKCFSAGYDLGGGSVGEEPDYTVERGRLSPLGHRGLDEHLGPRQAGDRAGAQLLPRRRDRARHGVRPRLRRRGRADRLPRGALRHARHAVPRVDDGHAHRDGADAHRRAHERHRGRAASASPTARTRSTSSRSACSRSRSASRPSPPTSCRSTSARSTAPWTTWACGRRSAPAPSCARSPCTRRRSRSSWPTAGDGLTAALTKRDTPFGDYRTAKEPRRGVGARERVSRFMGDDFSLAEWAPRP